jgi:hypothetical protein
MQRMIIKGNMAGKICQDAGGNNQETAGNNTKSSSAHNRN